MPRRALAIVTACLVLIAAIVAGYWHMLASEKSRLTDLASNEAERESAAQDGAIAESDPRPTAPDEAKTSRAKDLSTGPEESGPSPQEASSSSTNMETKSDDGLTSDDAASPSGEKIAAEEDETAEKQGTDQTSASQSEPAAVRAQEPSSDTDAPPTSQTVDLPTFDVLRVEPDGSMVIAGHGPANATIQLKNGDETLGTDRSDAAGDFVVVLSDGLAPGPYAIKIVAETGEGERISSGETAIIDIPEPGRNEQLLAMVEAPNAPSRLIELPKAEGQPDDAGSPPSASAADETAEVGAPETPSNLTAAETSDAAITPAGQSQPEKSDKPAETIGRGDPSRSEAARPAQEDSAASDTKGAVTTQPPGDDQNPALDSDKPNVSLRVEAVEIDGDTIFVAGQAPAGATVRIYLNNKLLAEDRVSATNRFLAQTSATIPVGNYMVRADQLDRGGGVVSRVEVPFLRPAGTTLSAVAPKPNAATDSAEATEKPRTAQTAAAGENGQPPAANRQIAADDAAAGADSTRPEPQAERATSQAKPDGRASSKTASTALASAGTEAKSAQAQTTSMASGDSGQISDVADPTVSPAQANMGIAESAPARDLASLSEPSDRSALSAPEASSMSNPQPGDEASTALVPAEPNDSRSVVDEVLERNGSNEAVSDDSREEPEATNQLDAAEPPQTNSPDVRPTETGRPQPALATNGVSKIEAGQPASNSASIQTDTSPSEDQRPANGAADETRTAALDDAVPTISQAPLQSAAGRVIIRKGDTLWQISRDSYGSGSRYTVIYLANGDQIRDPNRIYPGQVFRMPPNEERQAEDSGQAPQ